MKMIISNGKKMLEILLNMVNNNFFNIKFIGKIMNNKKIDIKKEEKQYEIKDENQIIYAENEVEEEVQIYMAKKYSEEYEKSLTEIKNYEKEQIEKAIKESQNKNINSINIINQIEDLKIEDNIKDDKNSINYNNKNGGKDNKNIINKPNLIEEEKFDEQYGICPITLQYMDNPVLSPSGVYYEKSAIESWIEKNHTDPFTRENLTKEMLIEDEEYKQRIIIYRKKFNK